MMDADLQRNVNHLEFLILTTKDGEFKQTLRQSAAVLTAVKNVSALTSSDSNSSSIYLAHIVQILEKAVITLDHVARLQVNSVPGIISEDALAQLRQILTNIFPALKPSMFTVLELNFALLDDCRQELQAHLFDIQRVINHTQELLDYFNKAFTVCQLKNRFIITEFRKVSKLLIEALDTLKSKSTPICVSNPHLKTFFAVLNVPLETCLIALRLLFLVPLAEAKFGTVFEACTHTIEIYVFATNVLSSLVFLFLQNVHVCVKDDVIKSIHNAQATCNLICSQRIQAAPMTPENTIDNLPESCESKIYQPNVTSSNSISKLKLEPSNDNTESQIINHEHNYAVSKISHGSNYTHNVTASSINGAEFKAKDQEQGTPKALTSNCKDSFNNVTVEHNYASPEMQCSSDAKKNFHKKRKNSSGSVKREDMKDETKKKMKDQGVDIKKSVSDNMRDGKNGENAKSKTRVGEEESQCVLSSVCRDSPTTCTESCETVPNHNNPEIQGIPNSAANESYLFSIVAAAETKRNSSNSCDSNDTQLIVNPGIQSSHNQAETSQEIPAGNPSDQECLKRSPPKSSPRNHRSNLLKDLTEFELLSLSQANQKFLTSLTTRLKSAISQFSFTGDKTQLSILCKICGVCVKAERVEEHADSAFHKYNLRVHRQVSRKHELTWTRKC